MIAASLKVHLLDPSAFTPPYDRSLAAGLARGGAEVELVTSRFLYGPVPRAERYEVNELFYRRTAARGLDARGRTALKLLEHGPDMLRYRRHAGSADVVHWQWLTVQPLDLALLPRMRPQVLTAHDILPREPRPGQLAATRRLAARMDAVVAHSEHGAARLREELAVPAERVHVIPHGAFDYLTRLPDERPLPSGLAAARGPVVLFFGLLRPYKGLDVLLDAFRGVEGAELWIVGMPRMAIEPLREAARRSRSAVRFVDRFVSDAEIPAYFRRADLVVLPYREIDQSGVLYTALAFGKAMVLSAVGGFVELAERHRAARLVPPGDAGALRDAVQELLGDERERRRLGEAAAAAAAGPFSWDDVA
ncbi:MAG: glycosyltransferase family 4 protein, partial [Actinobacteria bacterium]|nr:glycosyltransferase family 4 protein [Actinomycetota bacterium]